jgi:ribosomal protein L37E
MIDYEKYKTINFALNDQLGKRALVKCCKCDRKNYALNVLSGICTWCGFNINNYEKNDD